MNQTPPAGRRTAPHLALLLLAAFVAAAPPAAALPETDRPPEFELVESWPVETSLDNPDIRDAADVWLEMIGEAMSTLDFAEFYASDDPAGNSRLTKVVEAIEAAAGRGCQVRFLVEEAFYRLYPEIPDRLGAVENIEMRRLDSAAFDGGVLHAKYFVVDARSAYIGSQNFDWRALDHIQELGVRLTSEAGNLNDEVGDLKRLFNLDWRIAGAAPPGRFGEGEAVKLVASMVDSVVNDRPLSPWRPGDDVRVYASPKDRIPGVGAWDEPEIVKLIDGAADSIGIQLLTYRPVGRDGAYYDVLESALKRAAARGVKVRLLLADWCKRKPTIDYVKSLALFPGIEVRMMTIPQWSGGFIPFARVIHAKYLVVDGGSFWLGTSNWEKGYFHKSRNVGVIGTRPSISRPLTRYFWKGWTSEYAYPVRPDIDYQPPRVGG